MNYRPNLSFLQVDIQVILNYIKIKEKEDRELI